MNLEELDASLPNGLHDLMVERLTLDFALRVATLDVAVWVGDLQSKTESEREARRNAQLTLNGLQFCALEPPDPSYPFAKPDPLWLVDLLPSDPTIAANRVISSKAFAARFFVNQWNAFIHVAALDVTLAWK